MALAQKKETITRLTVADLTPTHMNERFESAPQIAAHLRQQLENNVAGECLTITLPSAMDLSYFYERSVLDVLDALFALRKQGYEYRMYGLDGEILLWDPINRKPKQPRNPWHELIRPVDDIAHRTQHSIYRLLTLEG